MRLRDRLALAIATLSAPPAFAEPVPHSLPPESGLELREDHGKFPYLSFAGTLQIRARFSIDCSSACPSVTLSVSEQDAADIPHFIKSDEAMLPTTVRVRNDLEAAFELVGKDGVEALKDGTVEGFAGEVELSLNEYTATFECGRPSYFGTFLSVDRVVTSAAESSEASNDQC